MKELDLHGLRHHEIRDKVENFILINSNELPIRIIIGNSIRMRNLAENILNKHNFEYNSPAYNSGEIIVIADKDLTSKK